MLKRLGLSFTLCLALCYLSQAQAGSTEAASQPSPPPSARDTAIDRTMDFVNRLFQKQGAAKKVFKKPQGLTQYAGGTDDYDDIYSGQSVKSEGSCRIVTSLTLQHVTYDGLPSWNSTTSTEHLVHFDRSDPSSVTIDPDDSGKSPLYKLEIAKADGEPRSMIGPDIYIFGVLRAISGRTLQLADPSGNPVSYKIQKHDWVGGDCISPNICDLRAFRIGEYVTIKQGLGERGSHDIYGALPELNQHVEYLGYFNDKDLAEQAAKALVHALTLCHEN